MIRPPVTDKRPWYRQFWPWFLLALPGSVVIAGLTTVYIAFKYEDSLVADSYYADGLAINQVLEQDLRARQLNLSASLDFDLPRREIRVRLEGDPPGSFELPSILSLSLLHPTDNNKDAVITLASIGGNAFAGEISSALEHRYYLRLQPASTEWRLNGELDFSRAHSIRLSADD